MVESLRDSLRRGAWWNPFAIHDEHDARGFAGVVWNIAHLLPGNSCRAVEISAWVISVSAGGHGGFLRNYGAKASSNRVARFPLYCMVS